ncbi:MAG: hypothetical protein LBB78_02850, partial [Spirochaetaceae bacterium]|nr:hypothetical protein [Spirochaetaceae bacterium]
MKYEKIGIGIEDGYGTARVRAGAIRQYIPFEAGSLDLIKAVARGKGAGPPESQGSLMLNFFRFLLFVLFLLLVTFLGAAQNSRDSSVAVVDFVGDDAALTTWFHDLVFSEVENLKGFNPRPFALETFSESSAFKPDFPPDPAYLEGAPYVLTGEYYLDTETLQHFQLWLW